MQPLMFLYGSVALFAIILICLLLPKVRNRTRKCLGLFFLTVLLIHLATTWQQFPQAKVNDTVFSAVIAMLQTFSLDLDYQAIMETVTRIQDAAWLRVFVQIILMIAPIIGGAAVLTIIMNVFPSVKYRMHLLLCKKLYIFSSLDENSLYIAQSLIEKKRLGKWDCIVFTNAYDKTKGDIDRSLLYRMKNLNAITMCLEKSPEDLMVPAYVSVYYDFAGKDEMENINNALSLLTEKKGELEKVNGEICIYIYAQSDLAVKVTEHMYACIREDKRQKFYISVIPFITNAIFKTLEKHPLHQYLGKPEDKEELTVTVIGDGTWAAELIKTCFWAGQYPNKALRIVSFSKDPAAMEDRIHSQIPEWDRKGEDFSYCDFAFYPNRQDSEAFRKEMGKCRIWFVVMDDAKENIATGETLARHLNAIHLQDGVAGTVFCQIDDDDIAAMAGLVPEEGLPFMMCSFGTIRDQYAPSFAEDDQVSFGWMTEGKWAQYFGQKADFVDADYRNRSSKAAALHLSAKMYALGLAGPAGRAGEYKQELLTAFSHFLADEKLREEKTEDIAELEHRRWNAYIRSVGFIRAGIEEWMDYYEELDQAGKTLPVETKDPKRALHTCLVERSRDYHDLTTYLLPQTDPAERNWDKIREQYEKARKAQASGVLDEFDVVSVCLYNMGRKNADKLKSYDSDSVNDLVSCYVVYDALKKILSCVYDREVRYSDRLGRYIGMTCTTKWLSQTIVKKLQNANHQALAYPIGTNVLQTIEKNAAALEVDMRKGKTDIRRLTLGEYAQKLSKMKKTK